MDRQPPDLSLAVANGARRMTYAELAQARGISLASARRLVRRHGWPRQVGNDAVMRIGEWSLGSTAAVPPRSRERPLTAPIAVHPAKVA
jgi:hypothetical protein